MNRIPRIDPQEALALMCLVGITVGVSHVFGIGWALIVVSSLVLVYLMLPDRGSAP